MLGRALFKTSVTWGRRPKCTFTRFTDSIELGKPVSMLKHEVAIQRHLGGLEKWANGNLRKLSKDEREVLHLGKKQHRLATDCGKQPC